MVKKSERIDNQRIKKAVDSVPVCTANTYGFLASDTNVLLDFGFIAPSYYGKHDVEDAHVVRICMEWEKLEDLCDTLKKLLSDHKAPATKKKKI